MEIYWSEEKNAILTARYGFGFERVVAALADDHLIAERRHPNIVRYPNQRQYLVLIEDYVWLVPFVLHPNGIFLKTMYPSRKATKQYQERQL